MIAQEAKEQNKPFRLGIRMDPDLNDVLEDALVILKHAARKRGERITKDSFIQEAVEHYIVFLDKEGHFADG